MKIFQIYPEFLIFYLPDFCFPAMVTLKYFPDFCCHAILIYEYNTLVKESCQLIAVQLRIRFYLCLIFNFIHEAIIDYSHNIMSKYKIYVEYSANVISNLAGLCKITIKLYMTNRH